MAANRTVSVMVAVVLTLAALVQNNGGVVEGRTVDGLGRLLSVLSGTSSSDTAAFNGLSPALSFLPEQHPMEKRQAFDRTCKGVYDRGLFQKLERVCDDCYNLYRKPYVSVSCKAKCYRQGMYEKCVRDLELDYELYINIAKVVQG